MPIANTIRRKHSEKRQQHSFSTPTPDERPEPKLKICVLAACPFPANHGTPGSIRELVEATAERGHDVHVVTYHIGEKLPLRGARLHRIPDWTGERQDRKSTRLNSSHIVISYAVFCFIKNSTIQCP